MLVLARKAGEAVQIGDGITIYVVEIRGRQVRLGIEAPAHLPVHRSEVYDRIRDENLQAAEAPGDLGEAFRLWGEGKGDRLAGSGKQDRTD